MSADVVILTPGSSGSSLLTEVLIRGGYWAGATTKSAPFGNTHENANLVDLNLAILRASGYRNPICSDLPPPSVEAIESVTGRTDPTPFRAFLEQCARHRPWVWKDPRLTFTIHFWAQLTDFAGVRFVYVDREPTQSYAGQVLRRKLPMSVRQHREIQANYRDSARRFFARAGVEPLELSFEDLLCRPEATLERLRRFLGCRLTVASLAEAYRGALGRRRFSPVSVARAHLTYAVYRAAGRQVRFPRASMDVEAQ